MITAALGLGMGVMLLQTRDDKRDEEAISVPIDGLTRKEWVAFARTQSNGNPRTVTPSFRLGAFELTVRRLCDLGVMEQPHRIRFRGRHVWDAQWLNPGSLDEFHEDPLGQYRLFAESIARYAAEDTVRAMVGTMVDETPATLSGVLSVAHRAGLPGLTSWLVDPKDRQRFSRNTTAFFHKANGLF